MTPVVVLEEKLKIKGLYITYYYLPALVPRSIVAYKHLENSKIAYDVFCAKTDRQETDAQLTHKKNIRIFTGSIIKKNCDKIKWIRESVSFFKKNRKEYNFIFTSFMPIYSLVSGIILKFKYKNIPWVSYYSDPPATNLNNKIILPKKVFMFVEKVAAQISYKKADLLIFTNQEQLEYCLSENLEKYRNKAIVLNHSFDEKLFPPKKIKNKKEKVVFSHFGRLFGLRTSTPLLEAIKILKTKNFDKYNKLRFNFYGMMSEEQITYIKNNKLDSVINYDFVNYLESLKLMRESDFLICIDAFLSKNNNVFFPSKLADYIGAKVPILAIAPEGTTKRICDNLGYITVSNNPNIIYLQLLEITNNYKEIKLNEDIIEQYNSKKVSAYLDSNIKKILKKETKS